MARRIRVKGVRKQELSADDIQQLSLVYWLQCKRLLREKRLAEAKAKEKAKRREANHEQ
jgi:hypothetical protein